MDEVQKTINGIIRTHGEIIDSLKAERDELIERLDSAKAERDEARNAARIFRDLYVSQVGRTYPEEYRLSWEDKGDADAD